MEACLDCEDTHIGETRWDINTVYPRQALRTYDLHRRDGEELNPVSRGSAIAQ